MVFRSMVKDGAPFYDPLGLVSEGTKIDFQLETNSYLYGTRFMTWLARHYSPEKVIAWTARGDDSRAYYSSAFRQQFGIGLSEAWANWTKDEQTFQQGESRGDPEVPDHPLPRRHDAAAWIRVACLLRRQDRKDLCRLQLSRRRQSRRRH
jgi:hypothetical protein